MNFMKFGCAIVMTLALVACGGGGGDPGTPSGSATAPASAASSPAATASTPVVATPTMELTVVNSAGAAVTNHVLSQTDAQYLKVVLKDSTGVVVPYTRVTVTLDSPSAVFVRDSGSQLTDSSGIVLMQIAPANVNSSGTVRATATATVSAVVLTQSYDFQINAGTVQVVAAPTMALTVVTSAGAAVTNHVLSQTDAQYLKVVLKDSTGGGVPYTRVTVTLDSASAVLVPVSGAQLTDSSGVVLMQIAPANVNSSGTVQATATATVSATVLTQSYDFQITAGTVSLSNLIVSPTSVQKGQSTNLSVDVKVNGAPAVSNSVGVAFTTNCGTVNPASALVNSAGTASAVIQTNSSGNCTASASSSGVTTPNVSYTVTEAPTTGIQFVSAAPQLLYQAGSVGVNTSIVTFRVINSTAQGVRGVAVTASLTNTDGGINFCNSPSTGSSADDGTVTFSVCAGTLPATVQVLAKLTDTPTISTSSNLLTIQTGLPTQRFFDISATSLNFFAGGEFTSKFTGNSTKISIFSADRQGNPVPDGTNIVFVSEGGQINTSGVSSCLITNGRCSVDLIGQAYRPMGSPIGDPRPGRVTVLAYADGEESFVDANFNNRYDAGELIEDLGALYLDKDESGIFVAAYKNLVTNTDDGEFKYPMPSGTTGSIACPTNSNVGLSVGSTCNNAWDGLTKVRRKITIVFSGGEIGQPSSYHSSIPIDRQTLVLSNSTEAMTIKLADYNGNPLPADASVSAEVISPSLEEKCAASITNPPIGNTTEPTLHSVTLKDCSGEETVLFKVTVGSIPSSLSVPVRENSNPRDDTAPTTIVQPVISAITTTGATMNATINEDGIGRYFVLPDNAAAPSAASAAGTFGMKQNVAASLNIFGLSPATAYKLYFVAEDLAGNQQATVGVVSFTTTN